MSAADTTEGPIYSLVTEAGAHAPYTVATQGAARGGEGGVTAETRPVAGGSEGTQAMAQGKGRILLYA